jgi:hypothetical protein
MHFGRKKAGLKLPIFFLAKKNMTGYKTFLPLA